MDTITFVDDMWVTTRLGDDPKHYHIVVQDADGDLRIQIRQNGLRHADVAEIGIVFTPNLEIKGVQHYDS